MVLNLLKHNIPVSAKLIGSLRTYRDSLRQVGKRRLSVKRRREILQKLPSQHVWSALRKVFSICCRHDRQTNKQKITQDVHRP